MTGRIVAAALAPHPPHLVYAENPPQNEPRSEGGWETLRWGYERLRRDLAQVDHDVLVVLTPHWQTWVGWHLLGLPRFAGRSVDPVFPNLFRYRYDLRVDVPLAEAIEAEARTAGLVTSLMRNADFRIDYGTLTTCHLVDPTWSRPIVVLSSNRAHAWYSTEVLQEQAVALGHATRRAIEASGRRALLLASNSLSHRHFTVEPELPEDMSREHIQSHAQHLWDVKVVNLLRQGRLQDVLDLMPEFTAQAIAETDAGALTWLLAAMGTPHLPGELYAYGTVIGTGNAIIGWFPPGAAA